MTDVNCVKKMGSVQRGHFQSSLALYFMEPLVGTCRFFFCFICCFFAQVVYRYRYQISPHLYAPDRTGECEVWYWDLHSVSRLEHKSDCDWLHQTCGSIQHADVLVNFFETVHIDLRPQYNGGSSEYPCGAMPTIGH